MFSRPRCSTRRASASRARDISSPANPRRARPPPTVPGFLVGRAGRRRGRRRQPASNPQAQLGLAGSNNGSNLHVARNLFTYEDNVDVTRGRHQIQLRRVVPAIPIERELSRSASIGQVTFTGLTDLSRWHTVSFLYDPAPTEMNWRSLFGAWYAEDVIRLTPNLTLSLGFRDESSHRLERSARPRRELYVLPTASISSHAAAVGKLRSSPPTTPSFCRSRASASPGAPSAKRR